MKSFQDIRLECIRLAAAMSTAKIIKPKEIINKANELFAWVTRADDYK